LPLWSAPFGLLLLQHVPLVANATVLDIGCGTGFPLVPLAARLGPKAKVYGADPWKPALSKAAAKVKNRGLKNVQLISADASKLDFEASTFDLIVSNLGINNFENPRAVISECARILKPGGTLALTTNLRGHMKEFYEVYRQTLTELKMIDVIGSLDAEENHRTTIDSAKKLFQELKFTNTKVIQSSFSMRYANGTALLHDYFINFAFLDSWRSILKKDIEHTLFHKLEANLNRAAQANEGLSFSVPIAYLEFQKNVS
jgi:arsenite methyltransferase